MREWSLGCNSDHGISFSGAEGGSRACYWSQQLRLCFSSSFKYVSCHNGECGLITKDLLTCPAGCDAKVGCNECIQMSRCGWCARPGLMGLGSCQDGGLQGKDWDSFMSLIELRFCPVWVAFNLHHIIYSLPWPSRLWISFSFWQELVCAIDHHFFSFCDYFLSCLLSFPA